MNQPTNQLFTQPINQSIICPKNQRVKMINYLSTDLSLVCTSVLINLLALNILEQILDQRLPEIIKRLWEHIAHICLAHRKVHLTHGTSSAMALWTSGLSQYLCYLRPSQAIFSHPSRHDIKGLSGSLILIQNVCPDALLITWPTLRRP